MATITDVDKLRPELLGMSVAELERRRTEIDMAIAQKAREEEIKAKEALAVEANKHIDAVVAGVKWLHDNGVLPEKVAAGFSRADGMFTPAQALRNVTAESLVPRVPRARKPTGPVQRRRRRDPKTGELVPSKASQQA